MKPPAGGTGDIRVGRVVLVGCGLIACVLVSGLGSWALFNTYLAPAPPPEPPAQSVEPALQVEPVRDLEALRAEEDRILRSGAWLDRNAGIARIPIGQAKELLVKRSRREAGSAERQ